MAETRSIPRTSWWPLQAWGGDLHLSPKGTGVERLEEEIHNADLARLDALIVPALREGLPLFESEACRARGQMGRFPWRGLFSRRPSPFHQAVGLAGETGLRVWAQMDVLVGGSFDASGPSLARSRPRWAIHNAQGRSSPIGDDNDHVFLCPSNPEVVRLLCEVAVEIANRFPVSALVLDFRSLPYETPKGRNANCLCFQCQERVEEELGLDLQEVLDEGTPEVWREWQEWRNGVWCELVRRIRTQVWTVRPGMPVFIRATPDRPAPNEEDGEVSLAGRYGPSWTEWIHNGLTEMVLLDQGNGTQNEAERSLLDAIPAEDSDCLIFPLFHETPAIARPEQWVRPLHLSLPGWGLTQHLAQAWSSAILLKPGPRHGDASARTALEIDPLTACIDALVTAEEILGDAPLGLDVRTIRNTLLTRWRELDLQDFEGLIFQLSTIVIMLDQERESDRDEEAVPRGWVELARRLLRWHANLHCNELYLFDTG